MTVNEKGEGGGGTNMARVGAKNNKYLSNSGLVVRSTGKLNNIFEQAEQGSLQKKDRNLSKFHAKIKEMAEELKLPIDVLTTSFDLAKQVSDYETVLDRGSLSIRSATIIFIAC